MIPIPRPLEFLEKLAALVPPPRAHLTRFHGVLAPNARIRSKVVPKKEQASQRQEEKPKTKRMSWAKLLKRVFGIDRENCKDCGGKMRILSAIMEEEVIEKTLKHLGRPHKPRAGSAPSVHPVSAFHKWKAQAA